VKKNGNMRFRTTRNIAVPVLLLAVLLMSAGPLAAAGRVWISLGAAYEGFGGHYLPSGGTGLEPQILIGAWKTMGFRIGVFGSSDWATSVSQADVGFWKSFGSGKFPSILLLGISYRTGTDADGGDINAPGAHAGFRQEFWFGRTVGLYAQGVLRYWFGENADTSRFWPSLGGGLSLRF
jgi:hypothetical protein